MSTSTSVPNEVATQWLRHITALHILLIQNLRGWIKLVSISLFLICSTFNISYLSHTSHELLLRLRSTTDKAE